MSTEQNHVTTIDDKLQLPVELIAKLEKEFGAGTYKVDEIYVHLPVNMSGPGEARWNRYATIVAITGDLSKNLIGIYKELMFVDGPSGHYKFISIKDM